MCVVESAVDTSNLHRMESLLQKPPRETRGGEGGRGNEGGEKSARRAAHNNCNKGGATVRKRIDGGGRKKEVKEAGEGNGPSRHAATGGAVRAEGL